jgi:excisionase family DNA binding protein
LSPSSRTGPMDAGSTAGIAPKLRLLTPGQVAENLNVGIPTVRALLTSSELRSIQVGGRLLHISTQDLEDFIERSYRDTAERLASNELSGEQPVTA